MRTTVQTLTILLCLCVASGAQAESASPDETVAQTEIGTLHDANSQPVSTLTEAAANEATADQATADVSSQTETADAHEADEREVYIVTSMIDGKVPKVGPARHASIAICPKGVSPIVYENGVPISNWRQCKFYGTQVWERGFKRDGKRIDARATKICGISATTVERRMRCHRQLNVPLVHDCRHHVIQVLNLRTRHGRLKPACAIK